MTSTVKDFIASAHATELAQDMPIVLSLIRHVLWDMRQVIYRGGDIGAGDHPTCWEQKISWLLESAEGRVASAATAVREAAWPRLPS